MTEDMESSWLDRLIKELGSSNGLARLQARETLVAIGEPALGSLVELLGDSEAQLRWEAAKALTEIPEPAAIPGFIALLADRRSEIGWLAAVGLINMGSRSVPYVLQALTGQAGSKAFRQACHHVLNDLAKRNTVLQGILAPVVDVLGNVDPDAGVISSRAQVEMTELRALSGG